LINDIHKRKNGTFTNKGIVTLNSAHTNLPTAQSGFTLIELVIAIILVGILAVTALPRFLGVKHDASAAVMKGIAAGFNTVVEQVNYFAIVQGVEHQRNVKVDADGTLINTYFGTPQEIWDKNLASLMNSDIHYQGNGYYQPDSLTTPCNEGTFCVVDQTPASRVLTGKTGWGMFFFPRGRTVKDNCLAYYIFSENGEEITFREVSTVTDGC
jgi:MSHA pilin protein MshA